MAKRIRNSEEKGKKKEGVFKRIAKKFAESSQRAQKATVVLFILLLLSVIAGMIGFYLAEPAKEMYVSESTFIKESRNIYDYKTDSAELHKFKKLMRLKKCMHPLWINTQITRMLW